MGEIGGGKKTWGGVLQHISNFIQIKFLGNIKLIICHFLVTFIWLVNFKQFFKLN